MPDDPDWLDWRAGNRFDPAERWASWVLWNHFAGDGSWVGEERADDQALGKLCASSFEAAWDRAMPHSEYEPT